MRRGALRGNEVQDELLGALLGLMQADGDVRPALGDALHCATIADVQQLDGVPGADGRTRVGRSVGRKDGRCCRGSGRQRCGPVGDCRLLHLAGN